MMAAGFVTTAWCRDVESGAEERDGPTMYLGGGALIYSKSYVGVDPRVYPIPLFAYEGERLYLRGLVGGYRLLMDKGWSIGPIVQPRFEGYSQDESSALRGMGDRDWSIDAGLGTSWLTRFGLFELSGVTDILGRHRGQEVELTYTIMFPLMGFDFVPSAGMRWKSGNLVDYYYGVRPSEARSGRFAYDGDAALDPFLRLAVRRKITERWSLLAAAQYEWLDDEITDSPIVDARYDASFIIGMLYSW